jgi:hypothetical protein
MTGKKSNLTLHNPPSHVVNVFQMIPSHPRLHCLHLPVEAGLDYLGLHHQPLHRLCLPHHARVTHQAVVLPVELGLGKKTAHLERANI